MASIAGVIGVVAGIASALTGPVTFSQPRMIDDITVDCTIEETGTDEVTVTSHPVEAGANVSDHAYKNPAKLSMHVGFWDGSGNSSGDGYAQDVYDQLQALQLTLQPFTVQTGRRLYQNMMFASLGLTTDAKTAGALMITATFVEIIRAQTSTTGGVSATDPADQASPQKTAAPVSTGTVQPNPVNLQPGS